MLFQRGEKLTLIAAGLRRIHLVEACKCLQNIGSKQSLRPLRNRKLETQEDKGGGARLYPPTQGPGVVEALPSCTAPSEAPNLLWCHHRERVTGAPCTGLPASAQKCCPSPRFPYPAWPQDTGHGRVQPEYSVSIPASPTGPRGH